MSEPLSSVILARLRADAKSLGRPDVRNRTLDRLEAACDAISDGTARAVVKRGNPSAYGNWRTPHLAIIPPRIEEYVLARRAIDLKEGVYSSEWTGPVASSLRKEGDGMLAYIRAREHERRTPTEKKEASRTQQEWWHLVDSIEDDTLKARLMRELSEGREAKNQVTALKAAVRLCSVTFDIEAYLRGGNPANAVALPALPPPEAIFPMDEIVRLVERLTSLQELACFDLECDGKRVKQRRTKATLIEAPELAALRALVQRGG